LKKPMQGDLWFGFIMGYLFGAITVAVIFMV
jgi:hypothetical protein